MISLQIPDEALLALKFPPTRAEEELRQEFAVFLVKERLLGPFQARSIAGMSRLAFQDLLAKRHVPWEGSAEEALQDLEAALGAARRERP